MANSYGYNFYFKHGSNVLTFPITPGELSIKVGSNNKVVTLIDEGDINILKSPSLIEVEFEARFPMRNYPYSRNVSGFKNYFDMFKELKEDKESFRFVVSRTTPNGKRTWDTNLLVALEDFTVKESADEGDDVIIAFRLRQYKSYGSKTVKIVSTKPTTTSTSKKARPVENPQTGASGTTYTIKYGDCLWNLAKKYYGSGAKYTIILNANRAALDADARKHGRKDCNNGNWIWPGSKITIPAL